MTSKRAKRPRSNVKAKGMTTRVFKTVFEFFRRAAADTTGQSAEEVPDGLRERARKFLQGALTAEERAVFFREARLYPQIVELLAKEIQSRAAARKARRPRPRGQS